MITSPFLFYRGAATIMAADLAHTPATGIRVQCCGDAHLMNFGAFAGCWNNLTFCIWNRSVELLIDQYTLALTGQLHYLNTPAKPLEI
jgi:uncharacterized protein (DUF2252 family)